MAISNETKICSFLGITYDRSMLRYHEKTPDSFMSKGYHAKSSMPITDRFAGIYRTLPPTDRELVSGVIGDLLEKLDYEIETPGRQPDLWERLRYLEEDRHGGQVLEGGVEYMYKRRMERKVRMNNGIFDVDQACLFIRAAGNKTHTGGDE